MGVYNVYYFGIKIMGLNNYASLVSNMNLYPILAQY